MKMYRDQQFGTMDFEECNFRWQQCPHEPLPYNLTVGVVLIFRASWEFLGNSPIRTLRRSIDPLDSIAGLLARNLKKS